MSTNDYSDTKVVESTEIKEQTTQERLQAECLRLDSVEYFYAARLRLGAISQEEYNKLMEQTKVEKGHCFGTGR